MAVQLYGVHQVAKRILDAADEQQRRALQEDRNYGAPYSFWSSAFGYGLCTEQEYEQARAAYGSLWNYRGD